MRERKGRNDGRREGRKEGWGEGKMDRRSGWEVRLGERQRMEEMVTERDGESEVGKTGKKRWDRGRWKGWGGTEGET